jgi:hypothetical protein
VDLQKFAKLQLNLAKQQLLKKIAATNNYENNFKRT